MRPFFGIDVTENKNNETVNAETFLAAKPSAAMSQALDQAMTKAAEAEKQSRLALPLRIASGICGVAGGICALSLLRSVRKVTLTEAYHNAPWIFWVAGIGVGIWLVLKLLADHKKKTVLGNEDSTQCFDALKRVEEGIYREMNVPANAREVDVLWSYYKTKGDTVAVVEKNLTTTGYHNPVFKLFWDEKNLYLANLDGKYAIPFSAIQGIRKVDKHIRVSGWNKNVPSGSDAYKPYKLSSDQYGCIHMKWYVVLDLVRDNQSWEVWFPNYELPVIEHAAGIRAL